jgi:hypothetical protein
MQTSIREAQEEELFSELGRFFGARNLAVIVCRKLGQNFGGGLGFTQLEQPNPVFGLQMKN